MRGAERARKTQKNYTIFYRMYTTLRSDGADLWWLEFGVSARPESWASKFFCAMHKKLRMVSFRRLSNMLKHLWKICKAYQNVLCDEPQMDLAFRTSDCNAMRNARTWARSAIVRTCVIIAKGRETCNTRSHFLNLTVLQDDFSISK